MKRERRRRRAEESAGPGTRRGQDRLVINSAIVSVLTVVGVVTGFLDTAVIAAFFGIGATADAFYMAWTIPWVFGPLLTLSANSALVPAFTRRLELEGEDGAWRLFNAVVGIVGASLVVLAIEGVIWAPVIMRVLASGFDHEKFVLTVRLARILFWIVVVHGLVSTIRAFLFAHRVFSLPTLLTPLGDLTAVVILFLTARPLGIIGVAFAFLVGHVLQLAVALVLLARYVGFRLRPTFDLRAAGLREAFGMYSVILGGNGVRRLVILVERILASYFPNGTIFALNIGNKLNMMVGGVFFSSMTTVILPDLSAGMVNTQLDRVRRDLAAGFKLISLVSLPAMTALLVLRIPLVQALFERGAVAHSQTLLVASILGYYVLSIPGMGYFRLVQNFFYSAVSGRAASSLFVYAAVSNVVLDVLLARVMGAQGIALAWTLSITFVTLTGLAMLARRVPGLAWGEISAYVARVGLISVVMAAAMLGAQRVLDGVSAAPGAAHVIQLIGMIGAGGLVFVALAVMMRIDELQILLGALRRRFLRQRRRVASVAS